ncbi:unnamed protein product [Bursaphelenchus okinawaensis]|uniref:UPAR/Ly6 domain-containing protein n=1 Tax=Bursaphelenchus okinawaensis TaxID=465554 RepID=A0A811L7A2_9BILA|nr:unnamed protein product [Bursaphelenchus okinawaensis]CAG9117798.1 unnamed protein product [Bursaphelenchus okinawaensis]
MTKLITLGSVLLVLFVVETTSTRLNCNSYQDGRPLTWTGFETCAEDVSYCLKSVNKGSHRTLHSCDRKHVCKAGDTSVSDSNYDYYCCSEEKCNSATTIGVGVATLTLMGLKALVL